MVMGTTFGPTAVAPFSCASAGARATTATVLVEENPLPLIEVNEAPKVTGVPKVGSTLAASPGSWTPGDVAVAYQWFRNGIAIADATSASYTAAPGDLSMVLSVDVTATKDGFVGLTQSIPGGTVAAGTLTGLGSPTLKGKAKVGKSLTAVASSTEGVKTSVQWLRDGKVMRGATAKSLELTKKMEGDKISARVTYTKVGYTAATKTSKSVKIKK